MKIELKDIKEKDVFKYLLNFFKNKIFPKLYNENDYETEDIEIYIRNDKIMEIHIMKYSFLPGVNNNEYSFTFKIDDNLLYNGLLHFVDMFYKNSKIIEDMKIISLQDPIKNEIFYKKINDEIVLSYVNLSNFNLVSNGKLYNDIKSHIHGFLEKYYDNIYIDNLIKNIDFINYRRLEKKIEMDNIKFEIEEHNNSLFVTIDLDDEKYLNEKIINKVKNIISLKKPKKCNGIEFYVKDSNESGYLFFLKNISKLLNTENLLFIITGRNVHYYILNKNLFIYQKYNDDFFEFIKNYDIINEYKNNFKNIMITSGGFSFSDKKLLQELVESSNHKKIKIVSENQDIKLFPNCCNIKNLDEISVYLKPYKRWVLYDYNLRTLNYLKSMKNKNLKIKIYFDVC